MPLREFDELPDDARLWIFEADRKIGCDEGNTVVDGLDEFLEQWTAHGQGLFAARDWKYDRFIFVAVDQSAAGASGCSIDALYRFIKDLGNRLGASFIGNQDVSYRDGDRSLRVSREEFSRLATSGEVGPDTIVFDNTLTTVGDLREGKWEVPAGDSWHGKAFFRTTARS